MIIINTIEFDNNSYVIYCEMDRSHYYVAKYSEDGTLDTNLSEYEIKKCEVVLEEVMKSDAFRS